MKDKQLNKYQVVNGVSYKKGTAKEVIDILETARRDGCRLALLYGNTETGEHWSKAQWLVGYVGVGNTPDNLPVLLVSKRSIGGLCIMDKCIVEIRLGKSTGDILYTLLTQNKLGVEEKLKSKQVYLVNQKASISSPFRSSV